MKESERRAIIPGVSTVLEQHFPETAHEYSTFTNLSESHFLAARVLDAYQEPAGYFGLVTRNEMDRLERVAKAGKELARSMAALTTNERRRIEGNLAHDKVAQAIFSGTFDAKGWPSVDIQLGANAAGDAAKRTRDERGSLPLATGHRNWKIAAMAGVCREIWGEQKWKQDPKRYGPAPIQNALNREYYTPLNLDRLHRYRQHVREFANVSEKQDSVGPFGQFLEDILDVVGTADRIHQPDKKRSSAQAALRSWRDACKQFSQE